MSALLWSREGFEELDPATIVRTFVKLSHAGIESKSVSADEHGVTLIVKHAFGIHNMPPTPKRNRIPHERIVGIEDAVGGITVLSVNP